MATPIAMPKLGMSMREGTVVAWPVAPGDRIEKGRVVLVIESEKAEIEIEATASGFLRHVYVEPGRMVPCGTLLAALSDTPDEDFDVEAFRARHHRPLPVASVPAVETDRAPASPTPAARRAAAVAPAVVPVTPAARARARKLGVDLARVPGTGPAGRVTREDVEHFSAACAVRVTVADGVALEVPSAGSGNPVLLLPGFGLDIGVFVRQTPALSRSRCVRGVNPRGVGLSDAPEQDRYDVAQAAADAAALTSGPVHVVGASFGAAVAIELALSRPECVRSLTLITPFTTATPRLLAVIDAWCEIAAEASPEVLARAMLPWLFSQATLRDAPVRERTLRGFSASARRVPVAALQRSAAGLRAWSGSRTSDLCQIAAPTLVLGGAADLLTPDAPAIAAAIPGARCEMVPGAGHAVGLEAPEAVNAALGAHLGSVDSVDSA